MTNKMKCEYKGCDSETGKEYVRKPTDSWIGGPEFLCDKHGKGRKPVLIINTKEMPDKTYSCFVTFDGYDHSFIDITALLAQKKMASFLQSKNKSMMECWFAPTVNYERDTPIAKPPITYAKNRIDNL